VDCARVRYLSVAEARRLINACDLKFRPLVQAALQTGARYGELCRLTVADFNADVGTLAIQESKSGQARHIVCSPMKAEYAEQDGERVLSFAQAQQRARSGETQRYGHLSDADDATTDRLRHWRDKLVTTAPRLRTRYTGDGAYVVSNLRSADGELVIAESAATFTLPRSGRIRTSSRRRPS
jgi:integrase